MGSNLGDVIVREGDSMTLRIWVFSLTILVAAGLLWSGTPVQAEDDGGDIVFKNTKSFAPVVFSHKNHKSAGVGCGDCHDALFKKKQGSTDVDNALTMKSLRKGKFCGSCHDGKQAFSASKNCKQCHQK
jgi:c(7)-type cytochrome triheme protein